MSDREFPVRPDLDQLRRQARELLRAARRGDEAARTEIQKHHERPLEPRSLKLGEVQFALARSYGLSSWPRLVLACRITDAIWRDDADTVRRLVLANRELLHEDARGVKGNWGPPMSYAANLGRDRIVAMLRDLGATDLEHAFERACLRGMLETARRLHEMGARPRPGSVMGPAETQSSSGLALLLELGAPLVDEHGSRLGPVAMVLQTYARNPEGKHECLEIFARHGIDLPDTAPMAIHRGRPDLLERHLRRDPGLLRRTFAHREIYPPELGCDADESLALHGTPIAGTTLLHLSADYGEIDLARWLLERGADPNARAEVDAAGFGGHTPLFNCVVSQAQLSRPDDEFARLLLDHGADPNARASLRKRLRFVPDESLHEYRDVTPLGWGTRFHGREWVSLPAMRLIAERGGRLA